MNCLNCNNELKSQRATKKFCSDKCKLAYHRTKVTVSNDTLSDTVRETHKPQYVDENNEPIVGRCKWCNRKITNDVYGSMWHLVECCYTCVAKRNNKLLTTYPADV